MSWLSIPPPPVAARDVLLRKVTPVTVSWERLMIAAPPCASLAAIEPLLRVTLLKLRLPPSSTMKNLKLGAPLVGRAVGGSQGTDAAAACGIEMAVATTARLPAATMVVRARKERTATCDSELSAL